MRAGCINAACRLKAQHSGPCDTRSEDEVALALPDELRPAVTALGSALAFARSMKQNSTPALTARAAMWWLRDEGWELTRKAGSAT